MLTRVEQNALISFHEYWPYGGKVSLNIIDITSNKFVHLFVKFPTKIPSDTICYYE